MLILADNSIHEAAIETIPPGVVGAEFAMMQGNFYGLVITILTIMAAILLASQTLNKGGFEIEIRYKPVERQNAPQGDAASRGDTIARR